MNVSFFSRIMLCGTLAGGMPVMAQASAATGSAPMQIDSQQIKVTGIVKDNTGPIIGASISEKGTTNSTLTDINGNFTLNVGSGATLVVSYIGMKTVEVTASAKPMTIVLEEDSKLLNEVVVTALGIKRDRKALGYGLDEVNGKAFEKAKETNVINSMAGRVAGLVVSQTAGGPSGSTRVLLRGNTEMTGNNQPLYVVDGVPLDNTNFGSAGTSGGYDLGDGISSINPDDIETMSVLKGPAASALYGSRASHGVILITTKKAGKGERFSVEYNGTLTIDRQLSRWNDVQQTYGMGSNGTYSIDAVSNTNKSWGSKGRRQQHAGIFRRGEASLPNHSRQHLRLLPHRCDCQQHTHRLVKQQDHRNALHIHRHEKQRHRSKHKHEPRHIQSEVELHVGKGGS